MKIYPQNLLPMQDGSADPSANDAGSLSSRHSITTYI